MAKISFAVLLAVLAGASLAQEKDRSEIQVPPGYRVEVVVDGLNFPVDITFDDQGQAYIAEAGGHTYGTSPKDAPPARILMIGKDGRQRVVYDKVVSLEAIRGAESSEDMPEGIIPPLTGVTWHDGKLYVSHRSRYSVLDPRTGEFRTVINGLPSWGEFLNAKPIFDKDGKMVFFLSTQGNSGVIEEHWLKVIKTFDKMEAHEIPGEDVTLEGKNFAVPTEDPKTKEAPDTKLTGVFVPLGTRTEQGQVIQGEKICNGAFYRCDPDGSNIERICWGLRSSFGYRFGPDGRLIATMNSANPMEPRGLWYDTEPIYEIVEGEWYGWPDYFSGVPITDPRFGVKPNEQGFVLTKETREKLLDGKDKPRQPLVRLPTHSAAEGMVFGREDFGVPAGDILVAEMGSIVPLFKRKEPPQAKGDMGPESWPGFRVVQVNLKSGETKDFLVNRTGKPASATGGDGLERPIQMEWGRDGALFVVDFGRIDFTEKGMTAHPRTGRVWKVSRDSKEAK